jgi:hypothetical protein
MMHPHQFTELNGARGVLLGQVGSVLWLWRSGLIDRPADWSKINHRLIKMQAQTN